MAKNWFYRLLVSYLPLFFIIIVILIFVFLMSYLEKARTEAVRASQFLNQNIIHYIDSSFRDMDNQIVREMLYNKMINQFFVNKGKENAFYYNEIEKMLKDLKLINPLINSIYLVRFQDEKVASERSVVNLAEFGDSAFIETILNNKSSAMGWSQLRSFKEFSNSKEQILLSYYRKGYSFASDQPGLIVVNINMSELNSKISAMYDKDNNFVNVLDAGNQVLFDPVKDATAKRILSSKTSEYTGWTYQSGWFEQGTALMVNGIPKIWLLIGVFSILLVVLAIIFISYNNYRPVKNILSLIQENAKSSHFELFKNSDDLRLIQSSIYSLIQDSFQQQKKQEESLNIKRRQFFYDLLHGTLNEQQSEWDSLANQLNQANPSSSFLVVVMEIDKYADFYLAYNQQDRNLLKYALTNVVQEMAQTKQFTIGSEWTANQMTYIFVIETSIGAEEPVLEFCQSVMEWVNLNLKWTLTIALGASVKGSHRIPSSHSSSLKTLQYKAVLGCNRIIDYREVDPSNELEMYGYLVMIRSFVHRFRKGDSEWQINLEQLFTTFKKDKVGKDAIVHSLNYLIVYLDQEMTALANEYQELWQSSGISQFNTLITSFDTLDEVHIQLTAILETSFRQMNLIREKSKHHILIQQVREYVEQHFLDANFSLEVLSDHFELSSKHLSKLFKEEFGEKFVDFIILLRMNHAQRLLESTDDALQSIAEQSGYTSAIAFSRTFKKLLNLTPGEYRKESRTAKIK